jgi:putative hemolysin
MLSLRPRYGQLQAAEPSDSNWLVGSQQTPPRKKENPPHQKNMRLQSAETIGDLAKLALRIMHRRRRVAKAEETRFACTVREQQNKW